MARRISLPHRNAQPPIPQHQGESPSGQILDGATIEDFIAGGFFQRGDVGDPPSAVTPMRISIGLTTILVGATKVKFCRGGECPGGQVAGELDLGRQAR